MTSATRSISYAELEQRSNRVANALLAQGLARGDRVGIYLPNCVEIVEIEIACYKAGLIKAPFNARLSPREVGDIAANSDASIIVTTAARAEAFKPHLQSADVRLLLLDGPADSNYEALLARASDRFQPVDVHEHEVAVLHYTSGSSGVLKAAMQTFGNRLAQLRKFLMRGEGMQAGHVLGLVGPVTHASGMQMVPALCTGATIHLFSGFEPGAFMAEMQARRVTHTFMVPTMINMLLAEIGGRYRPLPDLQRLGYGAAPMAPARILQAMDVFGPILSQGYGAGETTSGVCGLTVQDHLQARASRPERLASCGRPFLESLVEVVDDEGRRVPEGEIGEIVVSGTDVFAGYWRAPELTAEVLKTAATTRATWPAWTSRALSTSWTARRTWSSAAASTSIRPRWSPCSTNTPRWPMPACSPSPTTNGARPWPPTSCSSPAWPATVPRWTASAPSAWAASSARATSNSCSNCPRTPTARSCAAPCRRPTGPTTPAR